MPTARQSRATIRLLLASIAAGPVLGVIVAWALASGWITLGKVSKSERAPGVHEIRVWRTSVPAGVASEPRAVSTTERPGALATTIFEIDPLKGNPASLHMLEWYAAGWPAHAMHGWVSHDRPKTHVEWRDLFMRGAPGLGLVVFPLRPIWSGLFLNSLLYAMVVFFALQAIRHVNRWSRSAAASINPRHGHADVRGRTC